MTQPYERVELWHHDPAHLGVIAWVTSWRESNPDAPLPSLQFGEHLGREAVQAMDEDIPRVELQRVFAAAGFDGRCLCDREPETSADAARRGREREQSARRRR
jgi:hypothetical protein